MGVWVAAKVGDTAQESVEAIYNSINVTLIVGGGVAGAIHRPGGPEILQQCNEIRRNRYPYGLATRQPMLDMTCGPHSGLARRISVAVYTRAKGRKTFER